MKRILIVSNCLILSFYCAKVKCQDFSPFNFSLTMSPVTTNNELFSANIKLGASAPLIRTVNDVLLAGGVYNLFHYKIQSDSLTLSNIFSVTFPITYVHRISENYKFLVGYEFGIGSDRVEFSHHSDYKHILNLCLINGNNGATRWVAAVQFYRQYAGLAISPSFYADFRLFNKFYFNGMLPFKPKITWKASEQYQLGMSVNTERNTFVLYEEKSRKYIDETQADFDLFYQRRLNKNFKISASVGCTFLHNLKIYEADEKVPVKVYIFDRSNKESIQAVPNGFEFKIRLFWSLNS